MPEANSGTAEPEDSKLCLAELNRFEQIYVAENTVLLDTDTGEELRSYIKGYRGVFVMSGQTGINIGFDEAGIFLVERDSDHVLFRAVRLRQRLLDPERTRNYDHGKVELTNLDTGETFVTTTAIPGGTVPWPDGREQDDQGRVCTFYPEHLSVEARSRTADYFEHILKSLRVVFAASVETGNPVRWC